MGYKKPRRGSYRTKAKRGLSGLGLFAEDDIPRGKFVIEYWGKTVSDDEADEVGGKYLFRIDGGKTILGNHAQNAARLMNHACKPNCEAELDGARIFIYTRRRVVAGEELTYDYGKEYFDDHIGKRCRCVSCASVT